MTGEFTPEPESRLGRMAGAMLFTLENHPDYHAGDRGMVLLTGDRVTETMLEAINGMHGFETAEEAFDCLVKEMVAMGQAIGKDVQVHELGEG